MDVDTFCLKWNDFQNNVSKTLSDFRRDEEFFDVTLVSEDLQHISAHKLVLSACSELFKLILRKSSHPYPHPNPLIYLNGFRAKELNFIMEYIYHGEVRILQDDIHNRISSPVSCNEKFKHATRLTKIRAKELGQTGMLHSL